jgi:hypothetical protein
MVPFGMSVANSTDSEWSTDVVAGGEDGESDPVVTVTDVGVGVEFVCKLDVRLVGSASDTSCGSGLSVSFLTIDGVCIRLVI